jgi:F0F1-type ATP synthase membrane subunit c/vacuolar-type H+-ATPase subunit K
MLMQFLRKSALALIVVLCTTSLLWFGVLLGINHLAGTPAPLKQALKESGVYNSVINDALAAAQTKQENNQQGEPVLPANSPELRAIISESFPPRYLQAQTESVLDSLYKWLNGDTATLAFSLDLNEAKMRLAAGVEKYAGQRLAALPLCTPQTMPPGEIDAFKASCLPPGFDIAGATVQAKQQILNGEFLQDTTLNAEDLKGKDGRPVTEQYKAAPDIYQGAKKGIYALGVLTVLLGIATVFLSAYWRAGLHKLAGIGISVGSALILLSLLLGYGTRRTLEYFAKQPESNEPLQQTLMRGAELLAGDLRTWWFGFGVALLVLGIGGLIALHFTRPKPESVAAEVATPSTSDLIKIKKTEPHPGSNLKTGPANPKGQR